MHSPGRPFQSARVLLQSRWIPPFLFFYCCLCAIGCFLMCQYIQRPKEKKKNRTDKRKKERTKYFEYYSIPSDKYILYVIMKSVQACAIPFFSLYMRLAGCFCRSIVVICCVVRYSNDWKKKKKKEEKKAKKKITRCIYPIWRGKREENDFFLLLNRKKSRARKRGCRGREREKEAAARRVH